MRRYLSWIEGLTTNQYVGGSNPSRRTTYMFKPLKRAAFFVSQVFTAEWNWMSVCASKDASLTLDDATFTMDGAGAGNVHAIYFCNNNKPNL